ncbi:hypothetical protein ABFA07_006484 [Porites harrisoni]
MYNRRSMNLSDSETENSEGYVNKDCDRGAAERSTGSERRDGLPRTIRRKNSKVLTPEVLDLCAKEIQQESLFKKRYEQAALYVYGTNPGQHCGLESAVFSVSRMETSLKCLILRILASVASDISDRTKEEDLKLLSQLSNNGAR